MYTNFEIGASISALDAAIADTTRLVEQGCTLSVQPRIKSYLARLENLRNRIKVINDPIAQAALLLRLDSIRVKVANLKMNS